LRERLAGMPWEEHVDRGEIALRRQGLDPDLLRAETKARFDQRLVEHDRVYSNTRERGSMQIATPGLSLGGSDASTQPLGHEPGSAPRSDRTMQWSPDMPFEDFAKLQARIRGGRPEATQLHIEYDGAPRSIDSGTQFSGRIQSIEGDRIKQNIGYGHTVTWSREELGAHFNDSKALDASMQPGRMMSIGIGRNGVVDAQTQSADRSWESLNHQPLRPWQQVDAPHLGHGHGR
jgi:hypothetical protein